MASFRPSLGSVIVLLLTIASTFAGEWITGSYVVPPESDYAAFFRDAPAPELKRTFVLPAGKVTSARWRIVAPGMCDAFVNGHRVTSTALPLWTSYELRVIADEYDISALLVAGENSLELRLGNGWWNLLPMKMWGRFNLRENLAQGTPCVQAELKIAIEGQPALTIPTDANWLAGEGPVVRNSLYLGESYDSRRTTKFTAKARIVEGPKGKIVDRAAVPRVVIYRRWPAVAVNEPKKGVYVVDFGRNFAGNLRFAARGLTNGTTVTFKYGELLHPDGTVNGLTTVAGQQKNDRIAPPGIAYQRDMYVANGQPDQFYEPRFTFHGFRYCEVSGLPTAPKPADFEALAYSADVADGADFTCDNPKLNRLREVCRNTFRANLQGVQSDCPARERFGYGGDLAATAESFILNYDMREFYRKVLRDRCDSAKLNGGVFTSVSPNAFPTFKIDKVSMGWTVDVPIVADLMVRYYGDLEIVAEVYPSLVAFLDCCAAEFSPDEVPPCIGDHEALEKADPQTTAICHYHQFLKLTAKLARQLNKANDADRFERTATKLEQIFREKGRYVPAKGYVGNGRQGEEAFALYHRMLPADDLDAAYQLLRKDVIAHDYAPSTGIFATQYMLELLTGRGDAELAGKVATHEGFPGWFHMLDRGATTLWETWAETDNIYSMNHPMFGSVAAWMMRGILGIKVCEDAVGCDKVVIEPHAVGGVTSANGWLDTPRGRISVSWKLVNGKLESKIDLPPGVTRVVTEGEKVAASNELFNGRDLTGWYKFLQHRGRDNDPKNVISVTNGVIRITGEEFGCLTTEKEFSDYRLTVEYRFLGTRFPVKKDWALDSGILFHSVGKDGGFAGIWMASHEMNLITGATGDFWTVHPAGSGMYLKGEASSTRTLLDKSGKSSFPIWEPGGKEVTLTGNQRLCRFDIDPKWTDTPNAPYAANERPTGEWNTAVLECRGDAVDCYFNGKHVNHATHVSPSRGKIQLQSEGCGVEFRRIALEPLAEAAPKDAIVDGVHTYTPKGYVEPKSPAVREALERFRDRKLGLMMHFGMYSQLGIHESWPLVDAEAKWSRSLVDWQPDGEAFKRQYWSMIDSFNPVRFQPEVWAEIARRNGFKYLVFTTKHHDGFCMFDSKFSDFKVTNPRCPFSKHPQADIVKATFDAFRAKGMTISCYFSKPDWHHHDYWDNQGLGRRVDRMPTYDVKAHPERWARYREFVRNQLLELTRDYGPLDQLWLDGGQVRKANGLDIRIEEIIAEARQIQPALIAVDRTVHNSCEDIVTPEQTVPAAPMSVPWESCITMGTGFSYRYDDQFKSPRELVHLLVDIVAKGGNLALNVAPGPDGRLPRPAIERMDALGAWLAKNGRAIYATRVLAPYRLGDWAFTRSKDGRRFAIRLWKEEEQGVRSLRLPAQFAGSVSSVVRLATGSVSQVEIIGGVPTFTLVSDDKSDDFADAFELVR